MNRQELAKEILFRLRNEYTKTPQSFVQWSTPLELVIGTVLSAQCTDKRVNIVTADLFQKYTSADDYADASLEQLQQDISSISFPNSKATYLKGIGEILRDEHGGNVPHTVEALVKLPGVGKKTASLIMSKAFGQNTGVAVDTHVRRLAPRLGLTDEDTNPDKISSELEAILDEEDYLDINEYLILHGRAVCKPRKPKCGECLLSDICPSAGKIH